MKRPGSTIAFRAETVNIGREGFYCLSPEAFSSGEILECTIAIPAHGASSRHHQIHCSCTVLRSEYTAGDMFGVACHIDDYSLSSGKMN